MAIDPEIYRYVIEEESYPDKAEIIREGGHGDWMYLVLEGSVRVRRRTPRGILTLATLREGAIFGEQAFLKRSAGDRPVSVTADGPVVVGLLDAGRMGSAYNELSPLMKELLSALAGRIEDAMERLVKLSAR